MRHSEAVDALKNDRLVYWIESGQVQSGFVHATRSGGWENPGTEGLAEVITRIDKVQIERLHETREAALSDGAVTPATKRRQQ